MKKLKPIKPSPKGCLNCGYLRERMPMNTELYWDFGVFCVTINGKIFYWPKYGEEKNKTLMYVENRAKKYPKSDFRLHIVMPLYDAEYQRQGKNNWVLVKKGKGFA